MGKYGKREWIRYFTFFFEKRQNGIESIFIHVPAWVSSHSTMIENNNLSDKKGANFGRFGALIGFIFSSHLIVSGFVFFPVKKGADFRDFGGLIGFSVFFYLMGPLLLRHFFGSKLAAYFPPWFFRRFSHISWENHQKCLFSGPNVLLGFLNFLFKLGNMIFEGGQ